MASDESLHRARLKERDIPGRHELEWPEVERVKRYFVPWEEDHLVLDIVNPITEKIPKAKIYCE
jgi:hypothetical protein